ncbi:MAG: hypothetical protein ACNA7J_14615, partial [Wenzhouxiangella sp.]
RTGSLQITGNQGRKKTPPLSREGQYVGVMYLASRPATLVHRCGFAKVGCNSTTKQQICQPDINKNRTTRERYF